MHDSRPSKTALFVALRRAAHQIYDEPPLVFEDPVSVLILKAVYLPALYKTYAVIRDPRQLAARAYYLARNRYAEDQLAVAAAGGVTQYVLLGAGLDTFAHRNPHPGLRVFEVDHPATQSWKRELLAHSGLPHPSSFAYAPVDFETESLPAQLLKAGHDPSLRTFFSWLGVTPYLTREALRSTVEFIATQAVGTTLVVDYCQPRAALPHLEQIAFDHISTSAAAVDEPLRLFLSPEEIGAELHAFKTLEDLGTAELNSRYFSGRKDNLRVVGSALRLLTARVL